MNKYPEAAIEVIADGINTSLSIDGLEAVIEMIQNQPDELITVLKRYQQARSDDPNINPYYYFLSRRVRSEHDFGLLGDDGVEESAQEILRQVIDHGSVDVEEEDA